MLHAVRVAALILTALIGSTQIQAAPEILPAPRETDNPWVKPVVHVRDIADTAQKTADEGKNRADSSWLLMSSAMVFFMVPGLALFYGGMVRRKNVLATMMQSFAALSIVGLWWLIVGYALAFGPSIITFAGGGVIGWHSDLFFLKGIEPTAILPGTGIPVYVHVMFQGMFAIITPALISGAIAERIRFWPFCFFMILWITFVYCPLAHMVWAFDWFADLPVDVKKGLGGSAIGLLGKMGALDFAGGTVVHIAAGTSGLAVAMLLRKRTGYPEHAMHPNSMVLTLLGAGFLWFGWFGFNGGSGLNSTGLAGSAFAATQAAAAAAGLSWMLVEWVKKGKPTALGLASGIVAGLVAVTPASGFVYIWGAIIIGLLAGAVCYFAVAMKTRLGYDDSLDAFGVHAVGGFLGAVLTGLFCYSAVNSAGGDGYFAMHGQRSRIEELNREIPKLAARIPDLKKPVNQAQAAIDDTQAEYDERRAEYEDARKRLDDAELRLEDAPGSAAARNHHAAIQKAFEERKARFDAIAARHNATIDAQRTDKFRYDATKTKLAGMNREREALREAIESQDRDGRGRFTQFFIQLKAALLALIFAFLASLPLAWLVHRLSGRNFTTDLESETQGLDQTEHGEVGFDFGGVYDAVPTTARTEPRAAKVPPGQKRFDVVVEGIENGELIKAWSELCVPREDPIDEDFKAIYPYVTTVRGNRFRLRGGDSGAIGSHIQKLFQRRLGKPVRVRVED